MPPPLGFDPHTAQTLRPMSCAQGLSYFLLLAREGHDEIRSSHLATWFTTPAGGVVEAWPLCCQSSGFLSCAVPVMASLHEPLDPCSSGTSGRPSGQRQGCPVQPNTCGVHAFQARIAGVSFRLSVANSLRLLFLELVCMGQDADMRQCGMRSSSFPFGDFSSLA